MIDGTRSSVMTLSGRGPIILAIAIIAAVLLLTWITIREAQTDSYQLLVAQGEAFTEALAKASNNAITAELFYDYQIQQRYADMVISLTERNLNLVTEQQLAQFATAHDLYGVYIYDSSGTPLLGATVRGPRVVPPEFVDEEVRQLFENPQLNYYLLSDEQDPAIGTIHYYLQMSSQLDRVVVLAADARDYADAIRETGIEYVSETMAEEPGIEYIIYQSTEGIIFASRRPGNLLAIESDPFLRTALESDTIVHRRHELPNKTVLEFVRPFSTDKFEFGLFRVGLSLDGYHSVLKGLILQTVIVAAVLLSLLVVLLLYLNSRTRRRELSVRYSRIKSLTDKIFDEMRTGVAVVDHDGVIRLTNRAFDDILGLGDPTGRRWTEMAPDTRLRLDNLQQSNQTGDEVEVELRRNGQVRHLLVARSKVVEAEVGDVGVVMVMYDITKLREFERISARRARLSEMGNLAAGVAHEIRNPLNTISIAAQRIASEFEPADHPEEFRSFTDKIRNETRRLNDIITRFLALSREDRKNDTAVRLQPFLNEIKSLLEVDAKDKGIELELGEIPDVTLSADPDRLTQLFQNLFNNSKEAMSGGPGKVTIDASLTDSRVYIRFRDTGPGIPADLRDEVLKPYFTTKEAGTGLGLPTVYQIVTDLGGELQIEESETGGAQVEFTLPVNDQSKK